MAYTPTFTFTAGTKAVASEVNQNFSDVNSASFFDKGTTNSVTGKTSLATTTDAELNIAPGGAPSTNLVDGDLYVDSGTNRLTIRHSGTFERYALFSEIVTTPVTETDGGTGQTTFTTGDILYASGANTLAKLAVGTNGQHLILAAGIPAWSGEVGDISSVTAGTNLNGGGSAGDVTLNLDVALTGMTSIVIAESAASLALSVTGSGANEVALIDGTNATGDSATAFRGGLISKRSVTNGQQGYGLVARGYISNELTPTQVTYTVDGAGDVTKIQEYVDGSKTILVRQVDIVYQTDKNPYTITEIGTAVTEMGFTSVVTTFTYASGAGASQSGDLVSMARTAS